MPSPLKPPVIKEHNGIMVVRDDLIPGGTKRRLLRGVLRAGREYVYASPAYGLAQLALALEAPLHGARATVFVAKRNKPHRRTRAAKKAGAKIVQVPYGYLSNVQSKARAYSLIVGATMIPFGGAGSEALIAAAALQLDVAPKHVWCVAGSGTLARGLHAAWPDAAFHVVQVGKTVDLPFAEVLVSPKRFEQSSLAVPPWPACPNYEAKAWPFLRERIEPGTLFWNVAGR